MKTKKTYIIPLAMFEDIDPDRNICDGGVPSISGYAPDVPAEGDWGAKEIDCTFIFDTDIDKEEKASDEFEYSI